eukprot:CAMPEP_0185043658 /NCGR_PEP_ID=MMETSP1103-20130426/43024_1 /TAXON_ID=36769 /ORGANISM="Paraphysomonas bandaiensis, Strain Caron Lab Isolate" /LENGTH=159 /DNA_ID=CAMNT_0027583855 /DNA_START=954 /DNA_END=1430 /DNA_ORIENTATION=+
MIIPVEGSNDGQALGSQLWLKYEASSYRARPLGIISLSVTVKALRRTLSAATIQVSIDTDPSKYKYAHFAISLVSVFGAGAGASSDDISPLLIKNISRRVSIVPSFLVGVFLAYKHSFELGGPSLLRHLSCVKREGSVHIYTEGFSHSSTEPFRMNDNA